MAGVIMANTNRPTVQVRNAQFVSGITKRLQGVSSLAIAGKTYTPAELVALFQSLDAKLAEVNTAEAKLRDAWAAYRSLSKEIAPIIIGFRHALRNLFGAQSEVLSDFGLSAPKRSKPTVETQAAAVKKRLATREARHTMGPKQKAAITGAPAPAAPSTPKA
jgi:hypothetical protein